MLKGYAGLPRKSENLEQTAGKRPEKSVEHRDTADDARNLGPVLHRGLYVVEVDRRDSGRFRIPLYHGKPGPRFDAYLISKRLFDLVGASLICLILSPLIIGIVVSIYVSGGSPVFRHRRVGREGVVFDCLKFRTMVKNADNVLQNLLHSDRQIKEEWLRDHKLRYDPRITRFGRFLRRTSLDELPQLWNVLRGDMSLVGPRPVVPDELRRYGSKIPVYMNALPGITGLWQVSGRNDVEYRRRVAMDVYYVRARSILLDLYILAKTLPAVFASSGAY